MANTENNAIINFFKKQKSDFLDKYYGDHSYDSLIGGRIINNNILQLRQLLGGTFETNGNIELFSKLNPKIKKMALNTQSYAYRYYLVIDLFVNNIKNKEDHEKYWNAFSKVYNENNNKVKVCDLPSVYIGLGRDGNSFEITIADSELGFKEGDFKSFKIEDPDGCTPLDWIRIDGTNSFFRVYTLFDIQDENAKKEMEKYYNLDYGLDKFEKEFF